MSLNGYRHPPMPPRPLMPVVVRPKREPANGIHLLLTLATCGLWLPFWVLDLIVCACSKPRIEYH